MLNRLFGDYLVKNSIMSQDQLNSILPVAADCKANIEIIALVNKVLTIQQIQEVLDKIDLKTTRFGDAAVEEGFITDDRLEQLLTHQNNSFLCLLQILTDNGIVKLEQIPALLGRFQENGQFTDSQMNALIVDDLEQIANIFVPLKNQQLKILTVLLVKTFKRLIDKDTYLERAYVAKSVQLDSYAAQTITGNMRFKIYLTGLHDNLLGIANYFTGATYTSINNDALDNVSEFLNCINGQFATNVSYDDIDVDMNPPEYSLVGSYISNSRLFVIPIHVNGYSIRAIYEVFD